jgi:hypothetical protein
MPKSNVKYPYEFKVLDGLLKLGSDLFGESHDIEAFIIKLDDSGQILTTFNTDQHPDFNFCGDWDEDEGFRSFLFLDVIERGEYLFIKWRNVSKDHIEKLLNIKFTDKDFLDSTKDDVTMYPNTHNVMF